MTEMIAPNGARIIVTNPKDVARVKRIRDRAEIKHAEWEFAHEERKRKAFLRMRENYERRLEKKNSVDLTEKAPATPENINA